MDVVEEKNKINEEILAWYQHDQAYVLTLVAYARNKNIITEEEAHTAKSFIDEFWNKQIEDDEVKKKRRSKYMISVTKKIGFTPTKILWRLTEQFPKYTVGDVENCEFFAHDDTIIKSLKMDSIAYYDVISQLVDANFLSKRIDNKRMIYKINFSLIVKTWEEDPDKVE